MTCKAGIFFFDTGSQESDWVILLGANQHSDELLETINDEIATEFIAIFVMLD